MSTFTVSENQPPPPNAFHDTWERGLDPFHADALPAEFASAANKGERRMGWFSVDWCGNQTSWVADGVYEGRVKADSGMLVAVENA
jgi:hypothetical protein